MSRAKHPSRSGSQVPGGTPLATKTLFELDSPITKVGSRVGDYEWDLSKDQEDVGVCTWDAPIEIEGVELGRLTYTRYRKLVNAFQRSVAARWLYSERHEGKRWNAKRVANAIRAARGNLKWYAEQGITELEEITVEHFVGYLEKIKTRHDGATRSIRDQRVLGDATLLVWRMRGHIDGQLGFEPDEDNIDEYIVGDDDPTPTALIPKPVLDHIIGYACQYVETFSKDIFAARLPR